MQSSGYRIVDYLESITVLYSLLCESVLQAVRVYSQRLSYRLEDYRSYNQAYQILESNIKVYSNTVKPPYKHTIRDTG